MGPNSIQIRRADPGDETDIARVQVDTWRHAYAGIVPEEFYQTFTYEARESAWKSAIANPERDNFVAVMDGRVIGFCATGPDRSQDSEYTGELYAIYVDPSIQGAGAGTRLFEAGMEALRSRGHRAFQLWVLEENTQGIRFYESRGGRRLGQKLLNLGGVELVEFAYGWQF